MIIKNLTANNILNLNTNIELDYSISISGLSGSGKTTFCKVISDESLKRIVTLLPKSEYRFLFSEFLQTNFSAQNIKDIPLSFFLEKTSMTSNVRSTVGTHTTIFKNIRKIFAKKYKCPSEFFSFNNSRFWCKKCKGRGSNSGIECKECNSNRYSNEITKYTILCNDKEYNIIDFNRMNIFTLMKLSDYLGFTSDIIKMLDNMIKLNIGYLSLDRIVSTLSGGEYVRLLLSEFMTYSHSSLLIIDEISIGLDTNSLYNILNNIGNLGVDNQLWFIDHSDTVINSAENKIFFGPKSGKYGGEIVKESPRPLEEMFEINVNEVDSYYILKNLHKRNINIKELNIPENRLTAIIGESGCGKSTLVKDCIAPIFEKLYKNSKLILIGQNRNQSITSKSTIETFLDIKNNISKIKNIDNNASIEDIINFIPQKDKSYIYLNSIIDLGLGYLNLNRKIQTLSTGEFQCIHLISELFVYPNKKILFIFDEPSKGLSQNILNKFMKYIRNILNDKNITAIMIEHNDYLIKNSDFIIDFGKRTDDIISELKFVSNFEFYKNKKCINKKHIIIKSAIPKNNGIEYIKDNIENYFNKSENIFRGGILKNISQTARWIYGDYYSDNVIPEITIDFEKQLYSKNTFLYECAGLVNRILLLNNNKSENIEYFDYYNQENLCKCCQGNSNIESFDISKIIKNEDKNLWNGLFEDDIMKAVKNYNYQKIKFLFKEVKKETGLDLNKEFSSMNKEEKTIFLYGYWKTDFYDTDKNTRRYWKGMIFLIKKYMKQSNSKLKDIINKSKNEIICPICNGNILNHDINYLVNGKDIRTILSDTIEKNYKILSNIDIIKDLSEILGKDIKLNEDVSKLDFYKQAKLKLIELLYSSFYGFNIVLKNINPFKDYANKIIENISVNNKVIICDYEGINKTKDDILRECFPDSKSSSFVYELFGYKKIHTDINKIRKNYPCEYCGGKKILKEEGVFEGIDYEVPCDSCSETGLSEKGLNSKVDGYLVKTWLNGKISDFIRYDKKIENIKNIRISMRIKELNKKELIELYNYLKAK